MTDLSRLSVVVAAWNGWPDLRRCLDGLVAAARGGAHVVVARNLADEGNRLEAEFPWIEDLPLPRETTVPELRAAGLARTTRPVVAFLEDHACPTPTWATALLSAHDRGQVAVGGPVEQGTASRALDWAGYFADYGAFAPPCARGPVPALSGINMSFRRDALEGALTGGLHETVLQADLVRAGHTLWMEPDAAVVHAKRYRAREAIRHAFHWARGYASRRFDSGHLPKRLFWAAATVLLPVVFLGRGASTVIRRPRCRGPFLRAIPWLAILWGAWALGESAGYLTGAGDSDSKWL